MLGAALGVGGATDAGLRADMLTVLDSLRETEVAASAVVASPGAGADRASALPRIEVHSLIDGDWLPASLAEPLQGRSVELINDEVRSAFFSTRIPYGELIHEKALEYDVDPLLVAAVVQAESSFRPRAVSPAGARGLMQLMPRTGRWMGAKNLTDPEQNVEAGVKYLKYLERRFDGNRELQIAAYNGGEGNVRRYRGVPPFRETRSYVRKVMSNYERQKSRMEQFGQDYAASPARQSSAR